MTFVHPNSAARPARIRILGTTPPPPPPRRGPNRPLLVACLVVAALGVGTLSVPLTVAVATLRHRLFDIRVVLSSSFAWLMR